MLAAMLLAVGPIAAQSNGEDGFGGSVMVATEYVFRSIFNFNEKLQILGDFNGSHSGGFYAGVSASNTGFGGESNSMELDPCIGHANRTGDSGFSYDLAFWSYSYPSPSRRVVDHDTARRVTGE